MNNPLQIYSGSNVLLYTTPINVGCRRRVQLMNEDSITVKFSDRNKMRFPVGTRIGDFYITKEQQEKYNAVTGGYDYELKFDAYYWLWANKLLFYVMPGVTNAPKETSFKLTATIDVHAAVILRCLSALGFTYGGSPFRVDTDAGFSTEAKYINYSNMSVLGGIQAIADAYECEWWVVGNAIHFGKCNATGEYDFTVGENVASITSDSKETAPNRLIVFGSTRNLPPNYRSAGASDTTEAIVVKRLMLPAGTPYLQTSPNIPEDEIVEKEITLDSVYPRTALTVSEAVTYDSTAQDGTTQTFYRIKYGTSFLFSKDYILPDEELHVVFESGDLNGMDFAVKFNPLGVGEKNDDNSFNPEAQMFEVVVNEDYGRSLPDAVLHPAVGDTFSLYGWDSTKMEALGLLAAAEQELLTEGNKLLAEYSKDKQTYTCPMMWDWCKEQADAGTSPRLGSMVNLHFVAGDAGRVSRIIGYEHDLDIEYSDVTYFCGEKVSVSRLKTLESKVEGITKDGSKVKVQNSLDFLSKRYSDRTPYQLASDMGFEIGNYLAGVSGGMFGLDKTDGQSFAEVFRLYVRGKAYFETLTIIEANTLAGKQYITPGGGFKCVGVAETSSTSGNTPTVSGSSSAILLESGGVLLLEDGGKLLTETSGAGNPSAPESVYRCYFLSEQDGEKTDTKIVVGDQVISEMFNAKTETTNKVSNHRYWRLVIDVNNDAYTDESGNHYGYIDLSKTDCESGSDAPQAGDVMVQLGNRTDKTRQAAMIFSTVDSDAPSIKLLTGIDSYTLEGKAIIAQGYDSVKGHAYLNCYGDTYIGDPDGSTYVKFDQDTKQLDIKARLNIGSTIGDKTIEEFINENSGLTEDIKNFVNQAIGGVQDQIDGVVETWFYNGVPTLTNFPAAEWQTVDTAAGNDNEKIKHLGDLYFDNLTGLAYRFSKDADGGYYWNDKVDSATAKALADAAKAQDTADHKRRIFTAQPTPPYDQGDLWVNATYPAGTTDATRKPEQGKYYNDILRCGTAKTDAETFAISDWGLSSNYTDDTKANEALNKIASYEYLKNALLPENPTLITGGLIMSTLISLGYTDGSGVRHSMAGMNGSWVDSLGGRTIGSWWGGPMVDLFDENDARKSLTAGTYATSMVRMDGSAYFANGNIGFRKDGSGWLGNDSTGIKFTSTGAMTFGSGVTFDVSNVSGLQTTLNSLANFNSGLTSLLEPVIIDANGTITALSWSQASQANAVRAKVGLYSDSFVSSNGVGSSAGGSGGGGTAVNLLTSWSDYTTSIKDTYALSAGLGYQLNANLDGLKLRVTALENGGSGGVGSLAVSQTGTGNAVTAVTYSEADRALTVTKGSTFLTATEADGKYVTLSTAQTISGVKTFNGEQKFVAEKLSYTDPWDGIECAIKVTGKVGVTDSIKAASFIKSGGTSSQFLMADGSVTTKKTLTSVNNSGWVSNAVDDLIVPTMNFIAYWNGCHSASSSNLAYCNKGAFGDIVTHSASEFLTTSAASSTYVKKAGDTMTGYLTVSTNSKYVKFGCQTQFYCHYETDAGTGHYFNKNVYVYGNLYAGADYNQLVWHAGNDGSGSGLDADLLDGYHETDFLRTFWSDSPGYDCSTFNSRGLCSFTYANNAPFMGGFVDISTGGYGFYLGTAYSTDGPLYYRSHGQATDGGMGTWQQLARVTDNVTSATKLQNARTLWGQSFDGTGNVSGNMTGVGSITASGEIKTTDENAFRLINGNYGAILRNDGYSVHLLFTNSGDVNGSFNTLRPISIDCSNGNINSGNGTVFVQHGGNVGIGTTSPAYKLDVNGTLRATSIVLGSLTLSYDSSAGALKIDGAAYTTGWFSAKGVGSDAEGSGGTAKMLTAWSSYTASMATTHALSAGLGYDLNTRLGNVYTKTQGDSRYGTHFSLSGTTLALLSADNTILSSVTLPSSGGSSSGSDTGYNTLVPSGDGNAVTSIAAVDRTLTIFKNSTFSLSDHTHSNYGTTLYLSGNTLYLRNGSTNIGSSVTLPTSSSGGSTSGSYLPLSGGTITGNLRLSDGNAYGRAIYFGSTDSCRITEPTTNLMSIYAAQGFNIGVPNGYGVILNGVGTSPSLGFAMSNVNTSQSYDQRFVLTSSSQVELQGSDGSAQSGKLVAQVSTPSDATLKTVTGDISLTVEQIAHAPAKNFVWTESGIADVGTLAQHWRTYLPYTVGKTGAGTLTFDYGRAGLLSAIITARRMLTVESRMQTAEERIAQLEERLSKYENNITPNENEEES